MHVHTIEVGNLLVDYIRYTKLEFCWYQPQTPVGGTPMPTSCILDVRDIIYKISNNTPEPPITHSQSIPLSLNDRTDQASPPAQPNSMYKSHKPTTH